MIKVKFRDVYHGQNFPVLRVHDNHGYAVSGFCLHDLFGCLLTIHLDIVIQADLEVIPIHRLLAPFTGVLNLHAPGVCQRQDLAIASLQVILIDHFQANDTLVIAACKTQDLGSKGSKGVITLIVLIYFYAIQGIGTDTVACLFIYVGFDPFDGADLFYALSDGLFVHAEFFGERRNYSFWLLQLAVDDGNRADGTVCRQHSARGIHNFPPRRLDITLSLMQILRFLSIIFGTEYHKVYQPYGQGQEDGHYYGEDNN